MKGRIWFGVKKVNRNPKWLPGFKFKPEPTTYYCVLLKNTFYPLHTHKHIGNIYGHLRNTALPNDNTRAECSSVTAGSAFVKHWRETTDQWVRPVRTESGARHARKPPLQLTEQQAFVWPLQTSLAYLCGMTMVMWSGLFHCRVGYPLEDGMFV